MLFPECESEWAGDNAPFGNTKCWKISEREINHIRIWSALRTEIEGNETSSINFGWKLCISVLFKY